MVKLLQLVFEFAMSGLVVIGVYSQILRPLVRKTPVFPVFRKRPNLEDEIKVVNEGLEEKKLQREIDTKRRNLGK